MSTNESRGISDIVKKLPERLKPEALKEKLYSALEGFAYERSGTSVAPGYHDCVTRGGVEISGFVPYPKQELRVDVSVLVDADGYAGF